MHDDDEMRCPRHVYEARTIDNEHKAYSIVFPMMKKTFYTGTAEGLLKVAFV